MRPADPLVAYGTAQWLPLAEGVTDAGVRSFEFRYAGTLPRICVGRGRGSRRQVVAEFVHVNAEDSEMRYPKVKEPPKNAATG